VNLPDAVTHVEQGQQSRSMPGRTGCQLTFFQQHDVVAPALFGKMIQRADAYYATANDDYFCLRFHDYFSCLPASGPGRSTRQSSVAAGTALAQKRRLISDTRHTVYPNI
jgi:hypothetical protein